MNGSEPRVLAVGDAGDSGEDFLPHLRRETVRMAGFRARLLAAVFAVAFPVALALSFQASRSGGPAFTPFPMASIAGLLVALILFEWALYRRYRRDLEEGSPPRRLIWHLSGVVEMTVPSIAVLAVYWGVGDPLLALTAATPWLYFPFIVLSTLYLDFWIASVSGLVAAGQYLLVASWLTGQASANPESFTVTPREVLPFFHIQKSIVLLITGVLAGFVAREIRRRTETAAGEYRERRRVLSVFGQMTAPPVVEELLEAGGEVPTERKRVAVMFVDVRGYSAMAEGKPPEEVVEYLNTLFEHAIAAVHRNGGIVHQLLGDGLMAIFGAPIAREDAPACAVRAAVEIVDGTEELVREGRISQTRLGVGLHCGEVVAGLVGSNIHKEYKVTGDVVNVAARIEQACKDHEASVLCSETVVREAGLEGARDLGEVELRGRGRRVRLFRLR